jgi:hypothetical protein
MGSVEEKRFQLLHGPVAVLKTPFIPFPPKTLQKLQMCPLPNNCTPPTRKQINYTSRYNPRQPETFEENIPNGTSNLPMKKMVHRLPILFAHNTPINHNDVPLLEIVCGKDLP